MSLRELRNKRKISISELANQTGLDKGFIESMEADPDWALKLSVREFAIIIDVLESGKDDLASVWKWLKKGEKGGVCS